MHIPRFDFSWHIRHIHIYIWPRFQNLCDGEKNFALPNLQRCKGGVCILQNHFQRKELLDSYENEGLFMFSVVINWPKIYCRGRRGIIITKGSRTQLLQHSGLVCQTESSRVGAAAPSALCRAWSALCRGALQSSICTTCTSAGGQKCTKQNRQQQNCQIALFCKQHK